MPKDGDQPGEAASRMLQLLNAFLTVQALHVVAALGIADRLAEGPATVDDLADATGAHRPSLRGLLLDLPQVVADPVPLAVTGVADRCQVVGGDMLRGVPGGANAYLLKRVLMIWGDELAIRVLRYCAEALPAGGSWWLRWSYRWATLRAPPRSSMC